MTRGSIQCCKDEELWDALLAFSIQAFAGIRRSEVLGLKWGDIGDEQIRVTAVNAKTKKGRGAPISLPLKNAVTG